LKDHVLDGHLPHGDKQSAVSARIAINGNSGNRARIANRDYYILGGIVDDGQNSIELNRHRI
jgi:hypothetical protein